MELKKPKRMKKRKKNKLPFNYSVNQYSSERKGNEKSKKKKKSKGPSTERKKKEKFPGLRTVGTGAEQRKTNNVRE